MSTRDWQNFFTKEDCDMTMKIQMEEFTSDEFVPSISMKCANAIIREELEKSPLFYGWPEDPGPVGFKALFGVGKTGSETHTARLVDVKELNDE